MVSIIKSASKAVKNIFPDKEYFDLQKRYIPMVVHFNLTQKPILSLLVAEKTQCLITWCNFFVKSLDSYIGYDISIPSFCLENIYFI